MNVYWISNGRPLTKEEIEHRVRTLQPFGTRIKVQNILNNGFKTKLVVGGSK